MVYELVYRRRFREMKLEQETTGTGVAHQVERIRTRMAFGTFG